MFSCIPVDPEKPRQVQTITKVDITIWSSLGINLENLTNPYEAM